MNELDYFNQLFLLSILVIFSNGAQGGYTNQQASATLVE